MTSSFDPEVRSLICLAIVATVAFVALAIPLIIFAVEGETDGVLRMAIPMAFVFFLCAFCITLAICTRIKRMREKKTLQIVSPLQSQSTLTTHGGRQFDAADLNSQAIASGWQVSTAPIYAFPQNGGQGQAVSQVKQQAGAAPQQPPPSEFDLLKNYPNI